MPEKAFDPIRSWFEAAQDLGEYIGIRFGRVPSGTDEPEWIYLPHTEFDGIGGFTEILRQRGAELPRLPQIKHPSTPSGFSLVRALPKYFKPRKHVKWAPMAKGGKKIDAALEPPPAVAWHVFDEISTNQIRRVCRKCGVTVNSFLLKHLTKAIRPFLEDQSSVVPWMIPVNLRGKVVRSRDTENYTSYVGVKVRSYERVYDIHRNIYAALGRGEHWANWYGYQSGRFLTAGMKRYLVSTDKCMSQWNLGGFSNLGDWDSEKKFGQGECEGGWLFCPPVLRCQLVGAGCVTFQNRLSLTIQAHPDLTTNPAIPQEWIYNWIKEIEMDLSSVLNERVTVPWA
jgi:hypothetical protein